MWSRSVQTDGSAGKMAVHNVSWITICISNIFVISVERTYLGSAMCNIDMCSGSKITLLLCTE